MGELHKHILVRFSKKTGKIDTTLEGISSGMLQLWALQNTPKTKACIIVDMDEREVKCEYIGSTSGFPRVNKTAEQFEFNLPDEFFDTINQEIS